ncbi:hypothetical protein BDZ97DRAFT_1922027 [Flammula alnicola]|nr:hypothetical protein BDZ97DRAFT_1922027 [Flammula alnicola]
MAFACGIPRSNLSLDSQSDIAETRYVAAYLFKVFLYGLYTNLLILGVYLLCINRRTVRWPFITIAVLMFTIATADITLALFFLFRCILNDEEVPVLNPYPMALFFITNNTIADSVIIYRCYIVWRRKRRIVIVSGIFLLCSSICGYVFAISSAHLRRLLVIYLWMTFALNICLAVITAGRIYWSARRASNVLGPENPRRYYSIFAIIIDSGMIYPVYLLLDLIVDSLFLDAGLNQIVGIVPTLILAQQAFGRCIQDVETTIAMRRGEVSSASTPVLDSIFSLAGTAVQSAPRTPPDNQTQIQAPPQETDANGPV